MILQPLTVHWRRRFIISQTTGEFLLPVQQLVMRLWTVPSIHALLTFTRNHGPGGNVTLLIIIRCFQTAGHRLTTAPFTIGAFTIPALVTLAATANAFVRRSVKYNQYLNECLNSNLHFHIQIAAFAKECSRYYVHVRWRSQELCPMQCDHGLEYLACGPVCQQTCFTSGV